MCVHEIIAKGGFDIIFYKEMHFRRERVTGSLIGWTPTVNDVDSVMGIVPEVFHDDNECTMSVSDSDHYHVLPADGANSR